MNKIHIKKIKCFNGDVVINEPSLVNLIIGRNNSGKSTLTNVFEYVYASNREYLLQKHSIAIEFVITDDVVKTVFSETVTRRSFTVYNDDNQYEYGKRLIGKSMLVNLIFQADGSVSYEADANQELLKEFNDRDFYSSSDWKFLASQLGSKISRKRILKLTAERDIASESDLTPELCDNGNGATSVIDHLINVDGEDYSLIKSDLLDTINYIMAGESHYTDIVVVRDKNGDKNVCLFENNKRIKIKEMGSGLKTIILTILRLLLEKNRYSFTAFIFEELENNLHPEIQRRLFNYLYDFALKNNCQLFITSHSHVAINCFYGKDKTSIYHVYKSENGFSNVEKIESYLDKTHLLNDLGVKASDIFQSNGIIWVEGPSDRVFIKRWISLVDNSLKENDDYCFLYYGGKNLAHYTAEETNDLIRVLLINRNGLIVMDSDLDDEKDQIRLTKQRIKKEFEEKNMFVWITKGREIENYISSGDLNKFYGKDKYKDVGKYEKFSEYISNDEQSFKYEKVEFANAISSYLSNLDVLDLKEMITEVVKRIKEWNNR